MAVAVKIFANVSQMGQYPHRFVHFEPVTLGKGNQFAPSGIRIRILNRFRFRGKQVDQHCEVVILRQI